MTIFKALFLGAFLAIGLQGGAIAKSKKPPVCDNPQCCEACGICHAHGGSPCDVCFECLSSGCRCPGTEKTKPEPSKAEPSK